MGAWWANDPWIWWESLAIIAAIVTAIVLIVIIGIVGNDEQV